MRVLDRVARTATGAMHGNWGWGFLGLVAITLGPAGAIYGARRMRTETDAELKAEAKTAPRPTRKEQRRAATEQRRKR